MPKYGVRVLTSCSDGIVRVGIAGKEGLPKCHMKNGFTTGINKKCEMFYVIAWQPLPAPYQAKEEIL